MKRKTKRKNAEPGPDGSCHENDVNNGSELSGNAQGVRRSTRKRSAPAQFVTNPKKNIGYWSVKEKEELLSILGEFNTRQIGTACTYRYPFKYIRKRVGSKSWLEVKRYLAMLEHRAAGLELSQMKQQPPLESWCHLSNKMTVLTGDDCCRHLTRICSLMALESKDDEDFSSSKCSDHGKDVETTPASTAALAATIAPVAAAAPAVTTASEAATAPASTAATASTASTAAASAPVRSSLTPLSLATWPSSSETVAASATQKGETGSDSQTPALERAAAASAAGDRGSGQKAADDGQDVPDYASIYKYIGSLMQGETKELGPLESLVVLDCLKLVEAHLKGRDNSKQKAFAQERYLDILQSFYLSIDSEDDAVKSSGVEADFAQPVTVADLMDLMNQSQSGSHQSDQSGGTIPPCDQSQSASTSEMAEDDVQFPPGVDAMNQLEDRLVAGDLSGFSSERTSQSNHMPSTQEKTTLQDQSASVSSAANNKRQFLNPIGLGSINPFNIPLSLLEIRKGK